MSPNSRFKIVADQLAIDFANTEIAEAGGRMDLVEDFDSLLAWLAEMGVLDQREKAELQRRWTDKPLRADLVKKAQRLRRAIAGVIQAAVSRADVPTSAVVEINRVLSKAEGYRELVQSGDSFAVQYRSEWNGPVSVLAPIAASAADLLSHGDLRLIKKCENPECILHIYDRTKNHTRRWCSMGACGNRNKVKAYRHRKVGRQDGPATDELLKKAQP